MRETHGRVPVAAVDCRAAGCYTGGMNPTPILSRIHDGSNASNRDRPREVEVQTLRALERWENEGGRPRAVSPPSATHVHGQYRQGRNFETRAWR